MKSTQTPPSSIYASAAGFSLVEVLMSVLVLTVGLIGTALIELHAFRTTEQSNLHDTAVALGMQIADEMRANDAQMRLPAASNPFERVRYRTSATALASPTHCYSSTCSPAQWASQSVVEWKQRIQASLPGGRLEICRDATVVTSTGDFRWCAAGGVSGTDAPLVIKIGWYEKNPDGKEVEEDTASRPSTPRVAILTSPYSQ